LDDPVFEPAIIQPEETESTDTPAKPETIIVERRDRAGSYSCETYQERSDDQSHHHDIGAGLSRRTNLLPRNLHGSGLVALCTSGAHQFV